MHCVFEDGDYNNIHVIHITMTKTEVKGIQEGFGEMATKLFVFKVLILFE